MKKIFVVTGANRGLGEAFVDVLVRDKNYFVISMSRRLSEKQKTYSSKQFSFVEIDLANDSISEKIIVLDDLIGNDPVYFINNASIIEPIIKIEDLDENVIDKIISVNIKSTMLITKYLLKNFNINPLIFVNISSGAANRPVSNWSLYCSSKAFIQMFFYTAELEYKQHQFFNIDPGVIDTGMQKSLRTNDFPDAEKFIELQKKGKLRAAIDVAEEILKKILVNE